MSKPKKKQLHTGRDYNMVKVINGVTKAYVKKDKKKETNKLAARSKVEHILGRCLQCNYEFTTGYSADEDAEAAMECGFCSESCMDYYELPEQD